MCYIYTGFLIKCSILDIRQGSEYAFISEYARVLNLIGFWISQGYTRFWIKYFVIDVWQYSEYALGSEYATVLNILGSRKVWRKFSLVNIWQGSEYASSSENTSVAQDFVENNPSYMTDRFLSIPWVLNLIKLEYKWLWICQGYPWFCINCVLKVLFILNVLSSEYAKVWVLISISSLNMLDLRVLNKMLHRIYLSGFWIYHGFKMSAFWIY